MEELVGAFEGLGTPLLVAIVVLAVVQFSLMVAALVSLIRRPAAAVRGPKWVWALVVLFVNLIGPILYFALAREPEQVDVGPSAAPSQFTDAGSVADVLYGDSPDGAQR